MGDDGIGRLCAVVEHGLRTRPEFAHAAHLRVDIGGRTVHDVHLRGPRIANVFSVTKTVVATLVGIAVRDGLVPDLDTPVAALLGRDAPQLDGQTLRHLLTMTRGCETGGAWDLDAVEALPTGWVEQVCRAPRLAEPGRRFRYDDGAAHLVSAVLGRLAGRPAARYAAERLFAPLGITGWRWQRDPDGVSCGAAHLHLTADGLATLGALWLHRGRWGGAQLVDERFAAEMVAPLTAGGAPEHRGYGYFTWVDEHGPSAGGWAGQHVVVVPAAGAVVVTTGDPRFRFGPPHTDELADGWRPARDLVAEVLLPALRR